MISYYLYHHFYLTTNLCPPPLDHRTWTGLCCAMVTTTTTTNSNDDTSTVIMPASSTTRRQRERQGALQYQGCWRLASWLANSCVLDDFCSLQKSNKFLEQIRKKKTSWFAWHWQCSQTKRWLRYVSGVSRSRSGRGGAIRWCRQVWWPKGRCELRSGGIEKQKINRDRQLFSRGGEKRMRDERQLLFSESLGGWMGWGGLNVSQNMFIKAVRGTSMLACWVIRSKECVCVWVLVLAWDAGHCWWSSVVIASCHYSFFSLSSSIIEKQ